MIESILGFLMEQAMERQLESGAADGGPGGVEMPDIKLFVCCHKPTQVPEHPLLVPIQVGAALADSHFLGYLHDDTGDNISAKNRSYCELTAQYWVWKNIKADYYGFFHYRRYLYPDTKAKLPYQVEREVSLSLLNKLGYSEFERPIRQHDIIVPKGENMYVPAREHYAKAPYHHQKDLELAEQVVRERCPEMERSDGGLFFRHGMLFRQYLYHAARDIP